MPLILMPDALTGHDVAIASPGHSSSSFDRRGEILAVLGHPGRWNYRVRWQDGTETVVPARAARLIDGPTTAAAP